MKKLILAFSLLFCGSTLAAPMTDPLKILKKADTARGLGNSFSVMAFVTDFDGSEKNEGQYKVSVKDNETSLVEQSKPERLAGRKLLMKDVDIWMFTPNIKRPVRITLDQRLTGEVSNGDLARTNFSEDYKPTFAGIESIGKKKSYKLQLIAKKDGLTYKKIMYWIEQNKMLPIKAEFYSVSGKLLKRADYSDYKKIMGEMRFTKTTITDAIQPKKKSIIVYSQHKKEKFNESLFNKETLEK